MVIAFVGSGGKTTLIHRRAEELRKRGLKVFVTTSTRMLIEEDTLLTDDVERIIARLNETGYVMAGLAHGEKFGPLPEDIYLKVCERADAVLVEADGSKGLPLKYPAAHEPVIYENTDEIVVVCGLKGVGRRMAEVCHRPELVKACLGVDDDVVIKEEHVMKLLREGYLEPLRERHPGTRISVYPAYDGAQAELAEKIKEIFE